MQLIHYPHQITTKLSKKYILNKISIPRRFTDTTMIFFSLSYDSEHQISWEHAHRNFLPTLAYSPHHHIFVKVDSCDNFLQTNFCIRKPFISASFYKGLWIGNKCTSLSTKCNKDKYLYNTLAASCMIEIFSIPIAGISPLAVILALKLHEFKNQSTIFNLSILSCCYNFLFSRFRRMIQKHL